MSETSAVPEQVGRGHGREVHARTVAAWPDMFGGPCMIVRSRWPYECQSKDDHPGHAVYRCEPHGVWWHEPVTPDPLTPGERRHLAACPDVTCESCLEYIRRADEATGHVVRVEPQAQAARLPIGQDQEPGR